MTLSKKELAIIWGIPLNSKYGRKLRAHYFRDKELTDLDISKDRYDDVKTFSHQETKRIITYFEITKDQLDEVAQYNN